jgi:hypothetical protein
MTPAPFPTQAEGAMQEQMNVPVVLQQHAALSLGHALFSTGQGAAHGVRWSWIPPPPSFPGSLGSVALAAEAKTETTTAIMPLSNSA